MRCTYFGHKAFHGCWINIHYNIHCVDYFPCYLGCNICYNSLLSGTLTEEEQAELHQQENALTTFWLHVCHVIKATPSGSMLRDMALLDLTLVQSIVPTSDEEKVKLWFYTPRSTVCNTYIVNLSAGI